MKPEERIDEALDAVLKASGSALRHFTMPNMLADMRDAMRKVMSDSYIMGSNVGLVTLDQANAMVAAERERWREVAQRVAADANRYGCEGLKMRCTISDMYGLAPTEGKTIIQCPLCDKEYAVQVGYRPHYTSAFSLDELCIQENPWTKI